MVDLRFQNLKLIKQENQFSPLKQNFDIIQETIESGHRIRLKILLLDVIHACRRRKLQALFLQCLVDRMRDLKEEIVQVKVIGQALHIDQDRYVLSQQGSMSELVEQGGFPRTALAIKHQNRLSCRAREIILEVG